MQKPSPERSPLKIDECGDEEFDDTWEDLSSDLENQEPDEDLKNEADDENQGDIEVLKQPSFEVLQSPTNQGILLENADFLKLRKDIFSDPQTTFAFRNMDAGRSPFQGMNRRKTRDAKWMMLSPKEFDEEHASTPKTVEIRKRKDKNVDGADFRAGLAFGFLATNVAFALGFGLGWFCRDSVPTLAVYEYYLDPHAMM